MRRFTGGRLAAAAAPSSSIDEAAAAALFAKYADPDDDEWMSMEGIAELVAELGLNPESDVRVLVLCWKLRANERPGQVAKAEWMGGMAELGVDSIAGLKAALPSLDTGFMEHKEFRDFYRFCFKFNREDVQKKTVEKELVGPLLRLLLAAGRSPFTEDFVEFMGQAPMSRVSADEWNSFLEFSVAYGGGDLSGYDDDGAWPSLLDDFVDFYKAKQQAPPK